MSSEPPSEEKPARSFPLVPHSPDPPSSPLPAIPEKTHQTSGSSLHELIESTINITTPLHRLASKSSLGSPRSRSRSRSRSEVRSTRTKRSVFRPLSVTFEEQRHEPREGFAITKNTRPFHPSEKVAHPTQPPQSAQSRSWSLQSEKKSQRDSRTQSGISRATTEVLVEKDKDEGLNKLPLPARPILENKEDEEDLNIYPSTIGLTFLVVGLCLSVFLISLDRTIITTAIPFITSEFNSYDDIGWYGSAYLLTASAFQPLYGRIFQLFNIKWSYLVSLGIFLIGNLICAVSPNSLTLIVGRALAGFGSAGILTGSFVIITHAVPLQNRPVWTATVGLMFAVGATVGPLLGGVFTDLVTWRWCFYIALPVGGATMLAMLVFFHPPTKHTMMDKSFLFRLMELDIVGNIILLGAFLMLFLALSYTESGTPFSNPRVIGLLTGCGVTFIVFCIWQWWKADGALMPPRILAQRSVAASCAAAFCIYSAILIHSYYLPIWFQAVYGDSAVLSGVHMIPYVLANAFCSLLAGVFVSKNGYFAIPAIGGCAIGAVGAGLITTFSPTTSTAVWVGYEILASAGIGMAIQQGFTAIQIVLPLDEIAIGTAAIVAFQSLGGAIFVSVGNTILQNSLLSSANNNEIPGVDIYAVIDAGAGAFRHLVTPEQLPALLAVYNNALRKVFIAAVPMVGLGFIACLFLEWRSIKNEIPKHDVEVQKAVDYRKDLERKIVENHSPSRDGTGLSTQPTGSLLSKDPIPQASTTLKD